MTEFVGITLVWKRAIAAAKNLPGSISTQNEPLREFSPNIHSDYFFVTVEDIFTITSRAVGYIAFVSTMIHDLDNECSISMSLLKHVIDKSELPDGRTLRKISDLIIEKSCANGYILWILHAQKFAGHLVEEMWSDEVLKHLTAAIQYNGGVTRLYAILSLESFAMTGSIMRKIMSHQCAIQQLLNSVLLECDAIMQLYPPSIFNPYASVAFKKKKDRSSIFSFICFGFWGRKKSKHSEIAYTAQTSDSSRKLWFTMNHIQFCTQWFLKNMFINKKVQRIKCIDNNGVYEVRNDNPLSFQTYSLLEMTTENTGLWYYEVLLLTNGVVHIGWASVEFQHLSYQPYKNGFTFDTHRGTLLTPDTTSYTDKNVLCQAGDIIGTLLNLKKGLCTFFVHGEMIEIYGKIGSDRVFPIIGLGGHQHAVVNCGTSTWFYTQSSRIQPINKAYRKTVQSQYSKNLEDDSMCILCYSEPKGATISPCFHNEFCSLCVKKLDNW
ncbi:hypothetical protein BY458DRAFT_532214 [Sporodiniella umbellata]|nr:hypothetical protein BY458DRAFT_532214 [Sporodiniella umbellata]